MTKEVIKTNKINKRNMNKNHKDTDNNHTKITPNSLGHE